MTDKDSIRKGAPKSQSQPRPSSSPPLTGRQESLEDAYKSKMSVGPSFFVDSSQQRATGAVSKKTYKKIRHPTDPLSSQTAETRPKSPRRPSIDRKKTLSSSDSHLLAQSTSNGAKGAGSSSGGSPISHSPVTPTHKKPTLSQGGAGMTASQQKLHILLSSSHSALASSNDSTQKALTNEVAQSPKGDTGNNVANDKKVNAAKQSKGQRTPKKESKPFEPYMMLNEVQQGLKKGELLEGILRINPKNYQDAYISVPDEQMDIYLWGIHDRNRALNGDTVVVQLKPMEEWKVLCSDLSRYIIKNNLDDALLTANSKVKSTQEVLMTIKRKSDPQTKESSADEHQQIDKKKTRRKRGNRKKKKTGAICQNSAIDGINDVLIELDEPLETIPTRQEENPDHHKLFSGDLLASEPSDLVVGLDQPLSGHKVAAGQIPHVFNNSQVPLNSCPLPKIDEFASANCSTVPIPHNELLSSDYALFPVIDNFMVPDGKVGIAQAAGSDRVHGWDVAAASSQVAILQLEDLLTELRAPTDGANLDSLGAIVDAEVQYDVEANVEVNHLQRVVAPDELSEVDDSISTGGRSHCSEEMHQIIEDEEFLAANFSSALGSEVASEPPSRSDNPSGSCDADDVLSLPNASQQIGATNVLAAEQVPMARSIHRDDAQLFLEDRYFPGNHSSQSNLPNFEEGCTASPEMDAAARSQWKAILAKSSKEMLVTDLLELPNGKQFIQKVAKVVYISEQANSRMARGHLKPMADGNRTKILFVPTDHRFPRMLIPFTQCPADFFANLQAYSQVLFIARMVQWTDSSYAQGFLCESLGPVGNLGVETMGILVENAVRFGEFDERILRVLPKTPWEIPETELGYRRDFRDDCVFTIDPPTARDLDDAVSCKDLGNGLFQVGVHIADVSFFLQEGTPLDEEASRRATSIYMVQNVIPMLPRLLCEQLCSLQPGEDRLAFSVMWTIRQDGAVLNEWFGRSVINSCAQLSYDHAQRAIEIADDAEAAVGLPRIHGGRWTAAEIMGRVRILHGIAVHLRRKRAERGNLRLDQIKLSFRLDPVTGIPVSYHPYVQKDSNKLIEEFMLLANMAVAHRIYRTFPKLAILRNHSPPQDRKIDEVVTALEPYGIHLDGSTSETLHKSLERYNGSDALSQARMLVVMQLLTKPMNRAKYFCSGQLVKEELFLHYALNVPLYTHFTSPIRRYPDVMVHRLLAADLGYVDKPSGDPLRYAKLTSICNTQKQTAKLVQEQSDALFLGAYIRNIGGMDESAVVCAILDRSFDVQLLSLGVVKRIYCEQLPLLNMEFTTTNGISRLNLIFKPTREGEEPISMTIMLFTMVGVTLKSSPGAHLKFDAYLKLPSAL